MSRPGKSSPLYQRGYVDGFDACAATMVPRAERDGHERARRQWPYLLLVAALLALAGCAGNGPLGTGLGTVVATIKVTDASGKSCQVDVANGKDQTNLSLTDLSVCGGHLGSLHADRSDGAQAAINANAAVANHAIDVGAGLAGAALTAAGVPHGSPSTTPAVPPTVAPPVVDVPPPPPPPPAMLEAPDL